MKINKIKVAAKETREVDFFKQHTHKTSLFRFSYLIETLMAILTISGQPTGHKQFSSSYANSSNLFSYSNIDVKTAALLVCFIQHTKHLHLSQMTTQMNL